MSKRPASLSTLLGYAYNPSSGSGFPHTNPSMALKFTTSFLDDSRSLFRYYKKLAEAAMVQVTDEQLFAVLDPETTVAQNDRYLSFWNLFFIQSCFLQ